MSASPSLCRYTLILSSSNLERYASVTTAKPNGCDIVMMNMSFVDTPTREPLGAALVKLSKPIAR